MIMLGILSPEEMDLLLHRQIVGRIGCTDGHMVYVVPISYVYDGEYIYCHTHDGMKVKMMRSNPKVCFEVDFLHDMANWQSVVAWGDFEELRDPAGIRKALQKLHDRILPIVSSETVHLSPDWPFPVEQLDKITGITFRIRLTLKTGRFEKTNEQVFYAS